MYQRRGWKLEDSRRAGAVTQVPSESSYRTRSMAAMTSTAGSIGLFASVFKTMSVSSVMLEVREVLGSETCDGNQHAERTAVARPCGLVSIVIVPSKRVAHGR